MNIKDNGLEIRRSPPFEGHCAEARQAGGASVLRWMAYPLRLLLAQNLVHLFEGMTFGDWLGLLRRERFRIDPVCWPRAAWITGLSLFNSIAARAVERRCGPAIAATRV